MIIILMAKFFNRYDVAKMLAMGVALFLTASCIDDDYDLSNIDTRVGVGSDTLSLPGNNNTQDITLDDVFDLSYTHFVAVDEDGYYYLRADDNTTHSMKTSIAKIRATDNATHTSEFTFTREDLSLGPDLPWSFPRSWSPSRRTMSILSPRPPVPPSWAWG